MHRDKLCNGCRHLVFEKWPHGAGAARCMSPQMSGRVIEYSDINTFVKIYAPVKCTEGEHHVDITKRKA